jgi:hypothetical protein
VGSTRESTEEADASGRDKVEVEYEQTTATDATSSAPKGVTAVTDMDHWIQLHEDSKKGGG